MVTELERLRTIAYIEEQPPEPRSYIGKHEEIGIVRPKITSCLTVVHCIEPVEKWLSP